MNVGKVQTNGLEAVGIFKLASEWSWFNSFTYNDSQYKTNYLDKVLVNVAAGKQVVDAPKNMFNTELSYENDTWFAKAGQSIQRSVTTPI